MKTRTTLAGLCLSSVLMATPAAALAQEKQAGGRLYCWNQAGKRTCSDTLPAEQAGRARTEFSATSGRTLQQVDRALTREERSEAATAAQAARQQAEAEASRIRRDLAMVDSYRDEADLRRAFGERILLVDESIKTSVMSESNLRRGLAGLLSRASNLELAGKPVPKTLQDNILGQRAELTRQIEILDAQRADRGSLDQDLGAALQRYRDIKGGDTATVHAPDTEPAPSARP